MSVQAALDATALIAGGAQATPPAAGRYQGAGGIAGVKVAWSRPPENIATPYTHVSFPPAEDEITVEYDSGAGQRVTNYPIRMRLFIAKAGPNLIQTVSDALPFIERYLAAYEGHAKLTDLTGANPQVSIATIDRIRFEDGKYGGGNWLVLAVTLQVTEKPAVTFTP